MARFTLRPTKKAVDGADGAPGGSIPYGFVITAAWAWRLIVIGVVALALLKLFATLSSILMPLIIALIIAAPLEHLVTRMEKHRIPRGAGAAIVMLTLTLLVLGLLGAAGGTIAAGFDDLRQEAVEGFNTFLEWLTTGPFHVDPAQIDEWAAKAQDFLTKNWLGVANGALSVTSTIGSVLAGSVIALLGLFFFLKDGRTMWLWGVKHVGGSNAERIDNAGVAAWGTLGGYARTSATVALIDATGIAIGAWILGLPLVIPIAILVFLFSFVPMFGAAISGAIAVLVALVDGGWTRALIMLGVVVLVQQVEGTVLYPLLFGKTASVHPMVILLSVSAGTLLAGFLGAVIAVPFVSFVTTLVTKLRDPDARSLDEDEHDGAEPAPA
jgi:predicted PurR-regulated permease PerM